MATEKQQQEIETLLRFLRDKLMEHPEYLPNVWKLYSSILNFVDVYINKWRLSLKVANILYRANIKPEHLLALSDDEVRNLQVRMLGPDGKKEVIEAKHRLTDKA